MKSRLILSLALLLVVLLAACQPAAQPLQPGQGNNPGSESYPAPANQTVQEATQTPDTGQPLYPEPQSGEKVLWSQATAMILHGEVTKVSQSSDQYVTLFLKDGRTLLSREPSMDAVFEFLDQCGGACKNIERVTE
jgi:uncharacterized lipoprotein